MPLAVKRHCQPQIESIHPFDRTYLKSECIQNGNIVEFLLFLANCREGFGCSAGSYKEYFYVIIFVINSLIFFMIYLYVDSNVFRLFFKSENMQMATL